MQYSSVNYINKDEVSQSDILHVDRDSRKFYRKKNLIKNFKKLAALNTEIVAQRICWGRCTRCYATFNEKVVHIKCSAKLSKLKVALI